MVIFFISLQCYTHRALGWKVHIHDELPTVDVVALDCTAVNSTEAPVSTTQSGNDASTGDLQDQAASSSGSVVARSLLIFISLIARRCLS